MKKLLNNLLGNIIDYCNTSFDIAWSEKEIRRGVLPKKAKGEILTELLVTPLLIMNYNGVWAIAREFRGCYKPGKFIVYQGSEFLKKQNPSMQKGRIEVRNGLIKEGKLVDCERNDVWYLNENTLFNSPSEAASIIAGSNLNGLETWMVKSEGISYKEWDKSNNKKWAVSFVIDRNRLV